MGAWAGKGQRRRRVDRRHRRPSARGRRADGRARQDQEAHEAARRAAVVDAMTGQDAVNVAEAFGSQVGFDGVVLTKLDGDARGGAALSVKAITGKPILYASTGEKLDAFERFHPNRMAQRILGMGDVMSL